MLRASWPLIYSAFTPKTRTTFEKPGVYLAFRAGTFIRNLALTRAPIDERDDTLDSGANLPGYHFPPFPLVSATTSTPANTIYQRLPQEAADIAAQVAVSLPELLPEPESDTSAIFEDGDGDDYHGGVSALAPFTSTEALRVLVSAGDYDIALKVLDELLEVGVDIPLSHTYQLAAINSVKSQARTDADMEEQIRTFKKWFSLIPVVDYSRPNALDRVMRRVLSSSLNSISLVMEFGLLAADKGHAPHISQRVLGFICMYGEPAQAIVFLEEFCQRHASFVGKVDESPVYAAFRTTALTSAIRTLANAGRFDHAIKLLPALPRIRFDPSLYNFLIRKMRAAGGSRYDPLIELVADCKTKASHSYNPDIMPPADLSICIQCLVDVGQPDMAIKLLPHLGGPQSELVVKTLDYIQTRSNTSFSSPLNAQDHPQPYPAEDGSKDTDQSRRFAFVVRKLANAWLLDEALAILPTYHSNNAGLHLSIYALLLRKLKASFDPKYLSSIEQLLRLHEQTAVAARSGRDWLEINMEEMPTPQLAPIPTSTQPPHSTFGMAQSLRGLRKGFHSPTPSRMPSAVSIVQFFHDYLSSGRTQAIRLLRNAAFRTHTGSGIYILAELLFHEGRQEPAEVIKTFATYFFIVGLPRDELLPHLRVEAESDTNISGGLQQAKRHPDPKHTAVVWRALLELAENNAHLETLYRKLLAFARMGMAPAPAVNRGVPLLLPPPAWKTGVSQASFTPFIRRLTLAFGPERGLHVLGDMVKLGISPSIHQLTELAMAYSRGGQVKHTFALLGQAERAADAKARSSQGPTKGPTVPGVDLVLYGAVIRGFLSSGQIAAAREVVGRMMQRFGGDIEKNEYIQSLLENVEQAEAEDP
ncbi:hypothetical protein MIND_00150000 [Mycena indigotica]|uniref:Pentatricopeptide repeat protein n=1 Tax=Mycena indigotica TaxID=2126181 RepID=A0A8H6TEM6_9AGAR|nr:uncharacterized protein MIND_00150000 [Mycena indigotica]KAF7316313.1 hypothetical protein MIND_00150000 [Mycena indigotica]